MGGGPPSADVVRASCILTFPEESMVEPVPVDAWYLHAVGITFLRRLARDRVGDELRIALLMQRVDAETQQRRYISVNNDKILQIALKETFEEPERVLVLHIISLEKVVGQKSIHVTPEINPNVSPEAVAPLGMVFPTLTVEAVQTVPEAMALSSSFRFRPSEYDPEKPGRESGSFIATAGKQLAQSNSFMARSQEFGFTGKSLHSHATAVASAVQEDAGGDSSEMPFAFSAAGAKLIADHEQDHDQERESQIPLARMVSHNNGAGDAPRIPSDYVMLELQHGAGLDDVTPAMPATSGSTSFFISPTWHLQADELSASARIATASSTATTAAVPSASVLSAVGSAPTRTIREWAAPNINAISDNTSNSNMEESFVIL